MGFVSEVFSCEGRRGLDVPPTPLRAFFMFSVILAMLVLVVLVWFDVECSQKLYVVSNKRLCSELVCFRIKGNRNK
jgi:hypothetical protein